MDGPKSRKKGSHEPPEDRISNLPDAILCHVLSLMPTISAGRTSILSTRWKSIWTSVPVIDLEDYGIEDEEGNDPGSFMDCVDRVLLLHNSANLNKFRLDCGWPTVNHFRLNSWIYTAIKRHVQEVDLRTIVESFVDVPRHLFRSIDLVVLKLSIHGFRWSPLTVFLPRLKVLHLCRLEFLDDASLKNLLSGCPVLEELQIFTSERDKINTVYICSSTLKKLIVHNDFKERSVQCGVVIKTPSLESLELNDDVSRDFEVDELPALVKANFRVRLDGDDYGGSDYYCNVVVRMLGMASNVQHLRLGNLTVEVVPRASAYNELSFHCLTHLDVSFYITPWSDVPVLLGCFPSLTVFVMSKVKEGFKNCTMCWWSRAPEIVPKCSSLSLEKIEFRGFFGCSKEMKLVRYLLENSMVLKRLSLFCSSKNKKIKAGLQKYKRGSSTCQIKLCHQNVYGSAVFNSSVEWL